ncbi:MAG: hypothetical protein HY290_29980 [Planctomycetia bacterium]|nr:hypothetical protein [Planctomycetia bacterium]
MRRQVLKAVGLGICLFGLCEASNRADAADWIFRRSYYSHVAGPGLLDDSPPSRSTYAEPWVGTHPRFAIRGGWRFNNYTLQNGTSSDRTFYRENWYDVNY